jgi:hypothetical protein
MTLHGVDLVLINKPLSVVRLDEATQGASSVSVPTAPAVGFDFGNPFVCTVAPLPTRPACSRAAIPTRSGIGVAP